MTQRLAILAGSGTLPVAVAKVAQDRGQNAVVFRLPGSDPELEHMFSSVPLDIVNFTQLFASLEQSSCSAVCLIGGVVRPELSQLDLSPLTEAERTGLTGALQQGDKSVLIWLSGTIEARGYKVLGAQDVYPDFLTQEGCLTEAKPGAQHLSDLEKAARVAAVLGEVDTGQAVIVADGLVLAVEAQEGTDAIIGRITDLPGSLRGSSKHPKGVLFKRAMPGQDLRVDLPVIGPKTIELCAKAGLAGIGLISGESIIDQLDETLSLANEHGLFVVGMSQEFIDPLSGAE